MRHFSKALSISIALASSTLAVAAPVPGTGGGYYGSAWFNSGQGIVVGAFQTWAECNAALQSGIQYRVSNWGWTVTELNPCGYRPPFAVIRFEKEVALRIVADDPGSSFDEVQRVLRSVQSIRNRFNADDYEAALAEVE